MRPQFSMDQRNFLAFEYHKRRGTRDFHPQLLQDFAAIFPVARIPSKNQVRNIWKKQMTKGTINNCNTKASPGVTHSGRPRTARTQANNVRVKAVMDRDSTKMIGAGDRSPVRSARRNGLGISPASWVRIKQDIKYHPYKPVRRQELKPADYPRLWFNKYLGNPKILI